MENTKASIITPLYNGEEYIAETIESVIAQTYTDWEMIVVNDGSKDRGPEIVAGYAEKDNRITLINQENGGSAAARNNGIRRATGRYISLLDADDTWKPNFLQSQIELMQTTGAQLVCAAHNRVDNDGNYYLTPFIPPKEITYKDLLLTNSISCLTAMYDTAPHGKFYLDENFRNLRDDYIYWLTIIKHTGKCIGNQQILASLRLHKGSLTSNKWKMIKPQYLAYRRSQGFGVARSLYYLAHWAMNGIKKYKK